MLLDSLVANIDQCFSKAKVPQFRPCKFAFRRCHMQLQRYLLCAGDQIAWKKAEPNHLQIAGNLFRNYPSLHPHQLAVFLDPIRVNNEEER